MSKAAPFALSALLLAATAQADFTAANIQFLLANDLSSDHPPFAKPDNPAPMFTLEVANGWKYGDNFFFTDIEQGPQYDKDKSIATYGELHSRLSMGKITGADLSAGIFGDVLVAGEIDFPSGFQPTYLYGVGTDWKIPGAAFFMVNFFVRDEVATKGVSFQVNPAWLFPFAFGPVKGSFGGWMDFMTGEGDDQEMWWQMQPTLMVDVGNFWGAPGKLETGIEYEYFKDFLGVKDWVKNKPQFVLKWNL
ncbi:MAG: hypothetical protein IPK50_12545 [Fibrobacterota bacterium]|nr:MAG: hypothetical protein IPK50_12545 [Fibrobacterota bacterium]